MDLRHSLVPDEVIDKLIKFVPLHKGPDLQEDRGQPQYDYISFMDELMDGDGVVAEQEHAALKDLPNGQSPTRNNATNGKIH